MGATGGGTARRTARALALAVVLAGQASAGGSADGSEPRDLAGAPPVTTVQAGAADRARGSVASSLAPASTSTEAAELPPQESLRWLRDRGQQVKAAARALADAPDSPDTARLLFQAERTTRSAR